MQTMIPSLQDILHTTTGATAAAAAVDGDVAKLWADNPGCIKTFAAVPPRGDRTTPALLQYPNGCVLAGHYTDARLADAENATLKCNGFSYTGGIRGGEFDGHGTFSSDRLSYTGTFRRGAPHGKGQMSFAAEESTLFSEGCTSYDGEWCEGTFHGRGHYVAGCGEEYDGEWRGGQRHGHGVVTRKELHDARYSTIYDSGSLVQESAQQQQPQQSSEEGGVCKICYAKPANVLTLPCRHLSVCTECINRMAEHGNNPIQCPMCRTAVQDRIVAIVS